jgi:hypothetical protein
MDNSLLKEQAERCRRLAENADPFIKKRLLDLAGNYEVRLGRPSPALHSLRVPALLYVQPSPEKQGVPSAYLELVPFRRRGNEEVPWHLLRDGWARDVEDGRVLRRGV